MNRRLLLVLLIVLAIGLGFFREFVFININEQMRVTYYHASDSHVAGMFRFLEGYSYATLYYLKWPLTLFFAALFAGITSLIIRYWFPGKNYTRVVFFTFGAIFLLAFLLFMLGWLTGADYFFYTLARFLVGLAESPALLAVLIPAFYLTAETTTHKN